MLCGRFSPRTSKKDERPDSSNYTALRVSDRQDEPPRQADPTPTPSSRTSKEVNQVASSFQPTKFDILNWCVENSHVDVLWVLDKLQKQRPDVKLLLRELVASDPEEVPTHKRRPPPERLSKNESRDACENLMLSGEGSVAFDHFDRDKRLLQAVKLFSKLDKDGSGTLTPAELARGFVDGGFALDRKASAELELPYCPLVEHNAEVLPILQFSAPVYYCEEHEGQILVDVFLLGKTSKRCSVTYKTIDESAYAGSSYVEVSGTLVFEPGDHTKVIRVQLIPNPLWNTTTEFRVVLSPEGPEGISGAALGHHLFEARVRIIDTDFFPSNKFRDADLEGVSDLKLLWEYCKMTWNTPDIHGGTIRTMLVNIFHNFSYLTQLFMNVYLLDFIINPHRPESELLLGLSRRSSLIFSALLNLGMLLIAHYLDYLKPSFHMNGKAVGFLQNALLRKFLNYSREVREELESGDVLMAIDRDVSLVVSQGYDNCLKFARHVGQLCCMMIFEALAPYVFGHSLHGPCAYALFLLPLTLGVFLSLRAPTVERYMNEDNRSMNKIASDIALTFQNCNLVFDYNCRNIAARKFDTFVQAHLSAHRAAIEVNVNNLYFARWATVLAIAAYVWVGGMSVVKGNLSLGMFVTNLRVFRAFGTACEDIFTIVLQVQACLPSMANITRLLNLPTDVPHRMDLSREQQKFATEKREELFEAFRETPVVDLLPINIDLHRFQYVASKINFKGVIQLKQGQLVALVGHMDSGKATLLRLVSGALLPQAKAGAQGGCCIFVPSHLRVVNVDHVPLFYNGTLFENLAFGLEVGRIDASFDRIRGICNLLGIDKRVLTFLESTEERKWSDIFSGAQCKLLNIARALINNAELICFHKPLVTLDDNKMHVVMKALQEHVKHKGLLESTNPHMRRPRTVFITSSQQFAVQQAHEIIKVSHDSGCEKIEKVLKGTITKEMIGARDDESVCRDASQESTA